MTTATPSDLEEYVKQVQEKLVLNNAKKGKSTSLEDLEAVLQDSLKRYQDGLKILEQIRKQDSRDLPDCMRLHRRRACQPMKLARICVLGRVVVVPRYMLWFKEVRRSRPEFS